MATLQCRYVGSGAAVTRDVCVGLVEGCFNRGLAGCAGTDAVSGGADLDDGHAALRCGAGTRGDPGGHVSDRAARLAALYRANLRGAFVRCFDQFRRSCAAARYGDPLHEVGGEPESARRDTGGKAQAHDAGDRTGVRADIAMVAAGLLRECDPDHAARTDLSGFRSGRVRYVVRLHRDRLELRPGRTAQDRHGCRSTAKTACGVVAGGGDAGGACAGAGSADIRGAWNLPVELSGRVDDADSDLRLFLGHLVNQNCPPGGAA